MSERDANLAHAGGPEHGGDHHGGGHDDHHLHADHGSFKSYMTGFVLSVILTAIPFWLVMAEVFESSSSTAIIILGFAAVQMVVHMIYFLHMNTESEGGWSMLALIFTIMVVVITLAGSIWVMYNLNHNMMPGMMSDSPYEVPAVPGMTPASPHAMHEMPGMTPDSPHAMHEMQ